MRGMSFASASGSPGQAASKGVMSSLDDGDMRGPPRIICVGRLSIGRSRRMIRLTSSFKATIGPRHRHDAARLRQSRGNRVIAGSASNRQGGVPAGDDQSAAIPEAAGVQDLLEDEAPVRSLVYPPVLVEQEGVGTHKSVDGLLLLFRRLHPELTDELRGGGQFDCAAPLEAGSGYGYP